MSVQIDSVIVDNGKIGPDQSLETATSMNIMQIAHIMDIITTVHYELEGDLILIPTS